MIESAARVHSLVELSAPGFHELYHTQVRFVWRCLRRLGVPTDDVADAVQDVFVVVHRKLPEFEGRSKVSTWLYGICLRVASDRRRVIARDAERTVAAEPARLPLADESLAGSQERQVSHRQNQERLEKLLDTLPHEQREVFVLSEMENLSGEHIAELLTISEGTMRSRLRLARERFRAALTRMQARDE